MPAPKIYITLDSQTSLRRGVRIPAVAQKAAYARAVERAGGIPLHVAPTTDSASIAQMAPHMDGLLITGGDFDIAPELYGSKSTGQRLDTVKPTRTHFEAQLLRHALDADLPVLGICGGMQLLNVVCGGTLIQDIQNGEAHEQSTSPLRASHPIQLQKGSSTAFALARQWLPDGLGAVNSTHHQAVETVAPTLHAIATSPEGIVEWVSNPEATRIGVQWHPELLDDALSRCLYAHFVAKAVQSAL